MEKDKPIYEGVKWIIILHDPLGGVMVIVPAPNSVDRCFDSRSNQTKDWYSLPLHYDPTHRVGLVQDIHHHMTCSRHMTDQLFIWC